MRTLSINLNGELIAKFTTEERSDGNYISTHWDPNQCHEFDRSVKVFETYSGAMVHMWSSLAAFLITKTELDIEVL